MNTDRKISTFIYYLKLNDPTDSFGESGFESRCGKNGVRAGS